MEMALKQFVVNVTLNIFVEVFLRHFVVEVTTLVCCGGDYSHLLWR